MNTSKFAQYVHEYTTHSGKTRFAVAEWVDRASQYQWPLPMASRSGGADTGFAGRVEVSDWRYSTRKAALAAARRLYGERDAWSSFARHE